MVKTIYDLIVVGGGPAGVSAAINGRKNGLSVLLINGLSAKTNINYKIDNYYGFPDGITYKELIDRGIIQTKKFEVNVLDELCYEYYQEDGLQVCLTSNKYYGKTLVIATGLHYKKISVSNFDQFVGNGIHFCTLCDGFLYRNKKIALYGYGSYLIHEYEHLKNVCNDITIYLTSDDDLGDYKFSHPVYPNSKITALNGNKHLESITINGETINLDGLFVALGSPNSHSLATTAGIETNGERIVVNKSFETNLKGVFAIGDIISGITQIARSLYEGMEVINSVINYIENN